MKEQKPPETIPFENNYFPYLRPIKSANKSVKDLWEKQYQEWWKNKYNIFNPFAVGKYVSAQEKLFNKPESFFPIE